MLSLWMRVNNHALTSGFADALHVIETVEERIDKLRGHNHKLRELLLQRRVNLIIFLCGNLEILLQLPGRQFDHRQYLRNPTDPKQVLLIREGLLLLLPQLGKVVIVPIVVY